MGLEREARQDEFMILLNHAGLDSPVRTKQVLTSSRHVRYVSRSLAFTGRTRSQLRVQPSVLLWHCHFKA